MWLSRPGSALVYFWAMTTLGDQTRCSRGAAITTIIRAKADSSQADRIVPSSCCAPCCRYTGKRAKRRYGKVEQRKTAKLAAKTAVAASLMLARMCGGTASKARNFFNINQPTGCN